MKYCDIKDFKGLKNYCYKIGDMCAISINPTSPFHNTCEDNYLGGLYTSPTRALGYRLFKEPLKWCKVNLLKGIIYSYDTPIGLVIDNSLLFVRSKALPFKSSTTKKLTTILNRNFMYVELDVLKMILEELNIDLGWLE